jgi:hypothetical protein
MKHNSEEDLNRFLQSGELPAVLSKEFLEFVSREVRQSILFALTGELEKTTDRRRAQTIGLQVARLNTIRKAKGEL